MMYWVTVTKNGLKNLSRGGQNDVFAMFFDQKAWDRFQLSKEDLDLKVEMEKKDSANKNLPSDRRRPSALGARPTSRSPTSETSKTAASASPPTPHCSTAPSPVEGRRKALLPRQLRKRLRPLGDHPPHPRDQTARRNSTPQAAASGPDQRTGSSSSSSPAAPFIR